MGDKLSLRNGVLVRAWATFKEHLSLKRWVKLDYKRAENSFLGRANWTQRERDLKEPSVYWGPVSGSEWSTCSPGEGRR